MRNNQKEEAKCAAAIALSLALSESGETEAAIATALHLYLDDSVHDNESFVITISNRCDSEWGSKIHSIRQYPLR
ncbi:MAG: hypothetical protein HUJ91_07220 [Bacteroidales bacterium]|nr:hypothetical protein [Bacteroidales bacterium]